MMRLPGCPSRTDVSARSGNADDLTARYTAIIAPGIAVSGSSSAMACALDADVGRRCDLWRARDAARSRPGASAAARCRHRQRTNLSRPRADEADRARRRPGCRVRGSGESHPAAAQGRLDLLMARLRTRLSSTCASNCWRRRLRAALRGQGMVRCGHARMDAMRSVQTQSPADTDADGGRRQVRARSALLLAFGLALRRYSARWSRHTSPAARSRGRCTRSPADMNRACRRQQGRRGGSARRTDELGEMGRAVLVSGRRVELGGSRRNRRALDPRQPLSGGATRPSVLPGVDQQQVVDGLAAGLSELSKAI